MAAALIGVHATDAPRSKTRLRTRRIAAPIDIDHALSTRASSFLDQTLCATRLTELRRTEPRAAAIPGTSAPAVPDAGQKISATPAAPIAAPAALAGVSCSVRVTYAVSSVVVSGINA